MTSRAQHNLTQTQWKKDLLLQEFSKRFSAHPLDDLCSE